MGCPMPSVYFGGSRHWRKIKKSLISQVVSSVISTGQAVRVGCQFGADQAVANSATPSSLVVFAVAPILAQAPQHVQQAAARGARVVLGAGGQSAPMPARYLLRSIAAFQGCSVAVFFSPGHGSLAVAREAVSHGLQVFAFGDQPAPIPSQAGAWVFDFLVIGSQAFPCWSWSPAQLSLF